MAPEQGPEGEGEGEGHHEADREEKALARVIREDAREKKHARNVDVVSEFFWESNTRQAGSKQLYVCGLKRLLAARGIKVGKPQLEILLDFIEKVCR